MLSDPWPQVIHLLRNLVGSAQLDADAVVSSLHEKQFVDAEALAKEVFRTSRLASEVLRVVENIDTTDRVSIDLGAWVLVLQCLHERFRVEDVEPSDRRAVIPAPSFVAGRALIEAIGPGRGMTAKSCARGAVQFRSEGSARDSRALAAAMAALGDAGIVAECTSVRPCIVTLGPPELPTKRSAATQRTTATRKRARDSEADVAHVRRRARRV